jgi:ferredoxin-thioredoxin reductase catalytic chain
MKEENARSLIETRIAELDNDARQAGYHLNPDLFFTTGLVEGLQINALRYGYESCPCRLSMGERSIDKDIICPCDYRDADLDEYGACYCGLYVSEIIAKKNLKAPVVPERRIKQRENIKELREGVIGSLHYPVFRCKVCGYLCARTSPPEKCPICKASKDRFEKFL